MDIKTIICVYKYLVGSGKKKSRGCNLLPKRTDPDPAAGQKPLDSPGRNTMLSLVIHYLNYLDMTQHFCLANNS